MDISNGATTIMAQGAPVVWLPSPPEHGLIFMVNKKEKCMQFVNTSIHYLSTSNTVIPICLQFGVKNPLEKSLREFITRISSLGIVK